jgi:hypothetical protein
LPKSRVGISKKQIRNKELNSKKQESTSSVSPWLIILVAAMCRAASQLQNSSCNLGKSVQSAVQNDPPKKPSVPCFGPFGFRRILTGKISLSYSAFGVHL